MSSTPIQGTVPINPTAVAQNVRIRVSPSSQQVMTHFNAAIQANASSIPPQMHAAHIHQKKKKS